MIDLKDKLDEIVEDLHLGFHGLKTGNRTLDYITGGFRDNDLILLAARPAMGKTSFALKIIEEAALKNREKCILFSLEESAYQIGRRIISHLTKKRYSYVKPLVEENGQVSKIKEDIEGNVLYIDDSPCVSTDYIRAKCKENMDNERIRLVVVDYLQLCHKEGFKKVKDLHESLLRDLKSLAEELACPVLVLAQVGRKPELREDKRPLMSDLDDVKAVGEIADVVLFLYREEYYYPDTFEKGVTEVNVARNQHGRTGMLKVSFYSEYAGFGDDFSRGIVNS